MKDSKGMDSGQYNNKYMKMAGLKTGKLMKNHGNTSKVSANSTDFDMKRVDFLKKEKKGYDDKAFEYKY